MAIDFNALTSKLEHLTAGGFDVDTMTILCWLNADGLGENSAGVVLTLPESEGNTFLQHDLANIMAFGKSFTIADGFWTFSITDGQWQAVAVSYDRTSTLNDPVAMVQFAAATVTEQITPNGTQVSPATGYAIGNKTLQTQTWDGGLMHLFFHNVILTAAQMDQQLRYPGSVTTGGVLWAPMLNQNYTKTFTVSAGRWVDDGVNPTGTDLGARANTGLNCLVSRKIISIPKRLRIAA